MKQPLISLMLFSACAFFTLCACDDATEPTTNLPNKETPKTDPTQKPSEDPPPFVPFGGAVHRIPPKAFKNHWTPTQAGTEKKVGLQAFFSRKARRMSLDKIQESIPALFGGITWRDYAKRNMFERLSTTLGRADYVELTGNNNSVTKLFMKLMDDMAMNVCKQAIPADYKLPAAQRHFVRFENDIDENLRFVRLKFHAIHTPKGSTAETATLRKLYDAAITQKQTKQKAWELICIAVLTSPEFFIY